MIKKLFITLSFSLIFIQIIQSQNNFDYSITNIPPELLEDANAVIRHDIGKFHVEDAANAKQLIRFAVTRLNKYAEYDKKAFSYDGKRRLSSNKLKIKLYDAFGKLIRKIDKKEIKDRSYYDNVSLFSDNRYFYVDLSHTEYPYTIEYEYEIDYHGILVYPSWTLSGKGKTSVQKTEYTMTLPSEINLKYKVVNIDSEPSISESEGRKTYYWKSENLKPVKYETLCPNPEEIYPHILFTASKFSAAGYTGNMESWESYGKFMYELNMDRDNLSDEMKTKIHELTAFAKSDREKIDALYKYIQENMRYVSVQLGIGGWQAFDAEYVEKNKYGDCKALTWFMNSMLKELEIPSYPALVMAGEEYAGTEHPEDFSYPSFNHVILNVPSEDLWLECTQNHIPTGYLGDFTDNRSVLLISEKGGKLSKTPTISPEKNHGKTKTFITLTEKGAATVESHSVLTGPKHDLYRAFHHYYSKEDFEKWFLEAAYFPSFNIEKLETTASSEKPEATFSYKITVPKYGSKAGTRMFLPVNCINVFDDVPPDTEERQNRVVVNRGYTEEDEIMMELPKGFRVESIPNEDLNLETEFGNYSIKIQKEPGKLIYNRKFKILPVDLPPEKYNELRNFYKKVAKADKMKVVLVSKS